MRRVAVVEMPFKVNSGERFNMSQPTLTTERLILRKYKESDIKDLYAYASDPDVAKTVTWDVHQTVEDSEAFFKLIQTLTSSAGGKIFYIFAIELKESKKVIGTIDFKQPNMFCGQFDYALSSLYWNKGIVTEAALAVKDWAVKNVPQLVRLQSMCLPENTGSRRVMEKIGLELECIRRKGFVIKGQPVDLAHYSLILE